MSPRRRKPISPSTRRGSQAEYEEWQQTYQAWQTANPELAARTRPPSIKYEVPADLLSRIPEFPADAKIATRKAGGDVLQPLAAAVPHFISGSADLYGSTLNYINGGGDFEPSSRAGRNIRFGIREHAMCAMLNGIAYDGIFRPSGATFLVFADYCAPAIRLAALSRLPVIYIFTHDSRGRRRRRPHAPAGRDRERPARHPESRRHPPGRSRGNRGRLRRRAPAHRWPHAPRAHPPGRSRTQSQIPVATRREGVAKGGYIAVKETGALKTILMATGTELQHAIAAAKELGEGVRVVSMPCIERFDSQSAAYQEEVLPSSCRRRVAIEAGVPELWYRYVGLDGKVVGIPRFGISAPGNKVMEELGMTAKSVVEAAKSLG